MDSEWLMQLFSKITYEITFAITALLISLYSLYLSKKAINVKGMTIVRPVEFIFWNSNNSSNIKLYNTGTGVACNVRLLFHSFDHKIRESLGSHDIQLNIESLYEMNEGFFDHNQPLIIQYKLLSGLRTKTYWKYHMGETRYERFTELNKFKIVLYKIKRITLHLRSPIMIIKRILSRKQQASHDKDIKVEK